MLNKLSNFFSPYLLLFPQMHTNTPTHKHIHTEKSTQRYTCSKKKKTQIHKQTHTDKQQRDRLVLDRNDWYLTGTIGARGSCLIEARGYGSCLIGAREISDLIGAFGFELGRSGRCLWIGAREISVRSDLIGA